MRVIEPTLERSILEILKEKEVADNGASRALYFCDEELKTLLDLDSTDYVIKVALGLGGLSQLQTEVNCWLEYGDKIPLAEIKAAGRYIEVMEKVEPEDWRDFANECGDIEEYIEDYELNDEDADAAREAMKVVSALEDILGVTGDNGQLGRNQYGVLVSYDYGFEFGRGCGTQTSNISDYVDNENLMYEYISGLCNILNEENELLGSFEKDFLRNNCEDDEYIDHEQKTEYKIYGIKDDNSKFELIVDTEEEVNAWTSMLKSYKVIEVLYEKHYDYWRIEDYSTAISNIQEEDIELFDNMNWEI